MSCYLCDAIADDIQCQSCADSIIENCNNGECEAYELLMRGTCDGHTISNEVKNLIK